MMIIVGTEEKEILYLKFKNNEMTSNELFAYFRFQYLLITSL